MNAVANLLFAVAFLLAAYGALHFAVRLPVFPLREVRINGELAHVTPEQIEAIVKYELKGNFFTLDLAAGRAAFEKLPWVRTVNARRQWPDRLEVALEEHVPLARWGAAALVNSHGEVFTAASDGAPASREQGSRLRDATGRESGAALSSAGVASVSGVTSPKGAPVPPSDGAPASREQGPAERGAGTRLRDATVELAVSASLLPAPCASPGSDPKGNPLPPCDAPRLRDAIGRESDGALPLFVGPPGSAKEIAIQYGYFRRSLAAIGQAPVQVQVSPRRAWQIRLDNGLTLELGRERIESRLDRFVAVYDRTIDRMQRKLDYVDLRYPNGFALRIPELTIKPQDKQRNSGSNAKRG